MTRGRDRRPAPDARQGSSLQDRRGDPVELLAPPGRSAFLVDRPGQDRWPRRVRVPSAEHRVIRQPQHPAQRVLADPGFPDPIGSVRRHGAVGVSWRWVGGEYVDPVGVGEQEVRELVRRRGLGPASVSSAVRALVDDVISDYDDRTLGGAEPTFANPHQVARQVYDAVAGFGPLPPYLDDAEIEEIWTNERQECACRISTVCAILAVNVRDVDRDVGRGGDLDALGLGAA
jgi:hypothetical protein